ncbi:chromo domain-containing protein [Acinetobacter baumannii]
MYLVDRVIRRRKRGGKVQLLVKWRGYPDSMNSWVDREDVNSI